MTQAYRIVGWTQKFEVDKNGHATNEFKKPLPVDQLRMSPIPFLRITGAGHNMTLIDRKINEKAWVNGQLMEMAVHGLYLKLLLIAKHQPRGYRGWILSERKQPLSVREIAYTLGLTDDKQTIIVENLLKLLCSQDILLVEIGDFCEDGLSCALDGGMRTGAHPSERKRNRIEGNRKERVSDCATVSDSGEPEDNLSQQAIKDVCRILRVNAKNQSDITTLRDIFEQIADSIGEGGLNDRIYERMVDEAKTAALSRIGKWGRFINAMKREPFCYRPVKRKILGMSF